MIKKIWRKIWAFFHPPEIIIKPAIPEPVVVPEPVVAPEPVPEVKPKPSLLKKIFGLQNCEALLTKGWVNVGVVKTNKRTLWVQLPDNHIINRKKRLVRHTTD